jgi:serine/threonine-protein kinase
MRDPTQADARTDIYALGCVTFNLLTGRDPFEGATTMELCYHVLNTPAPRAASLAPAPLPAELDALVAACLEKDPALRPPDIATMMSTLVALAEQHPWAQTEACHWWQANRGRPRASSPGSGQIGGGGA